MITKAIVQKRYMNKCCIPHTHHYVAMSAMGEKKKATLTNSAHLPRNIAEQEKNSSRSLQQQLIKTFDTPHPVDFHGADLVVPY